MRYVPYAADGSEATVLVADKADFSAALNADLVEANYDYARQTLQDIAYDAWRNYDPEDTLRFYSLRLHQVGMLKHTPQEIIDRGTDWQFLMNSSANSRPESWP